MQASNQHIRRALRAYHCHACNKDFKEMVNLSDLSGVVCPNCQSDFFEEKKTFDQAAAALAAQPAPQPQVPAQPEPQLRQMPQMRPQTAPQQRPLMQQSHFSQQQFQNGQPAPQPQVFQQQMMGGFPMQQSQTFTQTRNGNGGWTQSVTISYGPGGSVQQTFSSSNANAMPQQQQQSFAGSAQRMPQMPNLHQHFHQMQDPEESIGAAQEPQMDDPFSIFDQILAGHGLRMGMRPQRPASADGCSQEFIRNLPPKEAGKECDCYICLDKCKEGAESVELPCKHAFCRDCIGNWIKEHDSCPVCRVKLDQNRPRPQQQQQQAQQPFMFQFL